MSPVKMSKVESAARTAMAFINAIKRGDLEAALLLVADGCVIETADPAPDGTRFSGREQIRTQIQSMVRSAESAQIKIEDLYGLGKRCILYWRRTWKDESGAEAHLRGVDVFLVEDDLVQSLHVYRKG